MRVLRADVGRWRQVIVKVATSLVIAIIGSALLLGYFGALVWMATR